MCRVATPVPPHPPPVHIELRTLPKWLQAALVLGVPSVIAMFMVYFMTTMVATRIAMIEQTQAMQHQTLLQMTAAIKGREGEAVVTREHVDASVARIERLVRQTCALAATNESIRATCYVQ